MCRALRTVFAARGGSDARFLRNDRCANKNRLFASRTLYAWRLRSKCLKMCRRVLLGYLCTHGVPFRGQHWLHVLHTIPEHHQPQSRPNGDKRPCSDSGSASATHRRLRTRLGSARFPTPVSSPRRAVCAPRRNTGPRENAQRLCPVRGRGNKIRKLRRVSRPRPQRPGKPPPACGAAPPAGGLSGCPGAAQPGGGWVHRRRRPAVPAGTGAHVGAARAVSVQTSSCTPLAPPLKQAEHDTAHRTRVFTADAVAPPVPLTWPFAAVSPASALGEEPSSLG